MRPAHVGISVMASLGAAVAAVAQTPLGTGFTYQGHFKQNGTPYTGGADMYFTLWDDPTSQDPAHIVGSQYGYVEMTNGLLSVTLNANGEMGPAAFNGQARWLEVRAAVPNDGVPYVTLTPRQPVSAAPYALQTRGISVDDLGHVGVGTSYPNARLHVAANSSIDDVPLLTLGEDAWDDSFSYRGDFLGGGPSGNYLRLRSLWNSSVMSWRGDGTVGIGVSSPGYPLTFSNALGDKISLWSSGGNTYGFGVQGNTLQVCTATSADRVAFGYGSSTNFTETMRIQGNGRVGIGTTAPEAPLHTNTAGLEVARFESSSNVGTWFNIRNATAGARYWRLLATGTSNGEGAGKLLINTGTSPLFSNQTLMTFDPGGNVGIGTVNPAAKLDVNGTTRTGVLQITGGADIAEPFNVSGADAIEPGMVVAIDPARPGELRLSDRAYDPTVAGIISGAGGVNTGLVLQQSGSIADGKHPVALTGRVWCYAEADAGGAIQPGDLLTTSATSGHAMKAADRTRAFGATIGKAMTGLPQGKGLVLVLVTLQ